MENGTTTAVSDVVVERVVVHPLVLLSVVDHFNRMGKIGSHKRVVGILLGSWSSKGVLDVTNSFAGKYKSIPIVILPTLLTNPFDMFFFLSQFLLMRMKRTKLSGFWTMTTWKSCTTCSRKSMVSSEVPSFCVMCNEVRTSEVRHCLGNFD